MTNVINSPSDVSYDVQTDWNDMIDYSEGVMTMLTSGNFMTVISSGNTQSLTDFMGYQTFVQNLNFSKVVEGMEMIVSKEMTMQDFNK